MCIRDRIWALWEDVENWTEFDERLAYAYLVEGDVFEFGATGYLKAHVGPKTRFDIIAFDRGVSFTESLKLPLGNSVELQRYFEPTENGETVFIHEVNFKGPLRSVMYVLLCRPFKKDLKLVVERLKLIAEQKDYKYE